MDNIKRYGRFTSSKNGDLMTNSKDKGFGKPALSYIKTKGMERRLGRTIDTRNSARPLEWGVCCEDVAFQMIGTEYIIMSEKTIVHKQYPFWSGSPDLVKKSSNEILVGDIKCPQTLKSFCTFVDAYKRGGFDAVRDEHDDGEAYYWQLVSNAILLEAEYGYSINKAELVVYMPYIKDLKHVRECAEKMGFQWIVFAHDSELPYLIEGGYYQDVNVLAFEIPQADKDALTERILLAEDSLTNLGNAFIASHDAEVGAVVVEKV
jgi:hypothetical protein